MSEMDIEAEYTAAKNEFEAAEQALARATFRLNRASSAMCAAFDKKYAEAESRALSKYNRFDPQREYPKTYGER